MVWRLVLFWKRSKKVSVWGMMAKNVGCLFTEIVAYLQSEAFLSYIFFCRTELLFSLLQTYID